MSLLHFKEHRKDFDLAFRVEVREGSHSIFIPHCLFRLDSSGWCYCVCVLRGTDREREMNVWLMWQCDFLILFFTGIMDSCFAFPAVSPRGRCFHSRLGCHVVLPVFTTVKFKRELPHNQNKINGFHFRTMLFVFMLYTNKDFLLHVKSIAN